jgi:hypothetical protein
VQGRLAACTQEGRLRGQGRRHRQPRKGPGVRPSAPPPPWLTRPRAQPGSGSSSGSGGPGTDLDVLPAVLLAPGGDAVRVADVKARRQQRLGGVAGQGPCSGGSGGCLSAGAACGASAADACDAGGTAPPVPPSAAPGAAGRDRAASAGPPPGPARRLPASASPVCLLFQASSQARMAAQRSSALWGWWAGSSGHCRRARAAGLSG